jgi:hypothetical protein
MKQIISILLLSYCFLNAFSQEEKVKLTFAVSDTQKIDSRLFDTDKVLKVILEFNIRKYKKKKYSDEYLDAKLTYLTTGSDSVTKSLRLRARGNFRREFCNFPPLMLNFRTEEMDSTEFSGIDKLKMVPYCKKGFQDYIMREYLIYRLYNSLTGNSFRVRLMEIQYKDSEHKVKPVVAYGFAIEPIELFEQRTRSIRVINQNITQRRIVREEIDRVAMFNYMIGNTDWAIPKQHNIQVFTKPGEDIDRYGIAVPYDFDYSGFVNASYAKPVEELGIDNFRERLYLGICRSDEEYLSVLKPFIEKKQEFYRIINDFPHIDSRSKKDITRFLDDFYKRVDPKNSILTDIRHTCKEM